MSFRLVVKLVTLNDLERCNTLTFAYFLVTEQYHVDGGIESRNAAFLRLGRKLYTLQCRQLSLVSSVPANDGQIGPECRSG